jgi:hypothetical protein
MCFRIEQRLLIALPVNIDKIRTQIAQQRLRGKLVVDEDLVSPGGSDLAPNDQLGSQIKSGVFKQQLQLRIRSDGKKPLNRSALRA